MMRANIWMMGMCSVVLAGCGTQAPAPVISGYGQPPTQVLGSAQTQAYQTIEPAAGPVTTAPAITSKTPEMKAVVPAGVPATAPRVTLPPPSILGDVTRSFQNKADEKGWKSYEVQRGDTIYRLSREFDASPQAILQANGMTSAAEVTEGKVMVIPAGIGRFAKVDDLASQVDAAVNTSTATGTPETTVAETSTTPTKQVVMGPSGTRYSLTQHGNVADSTQQAAPAQVAMASEDLVANVEPAAGPVGNITSTADVQVATHKVQAGETVYRIAQQYGASVLDIMNANDLDTPQALKAGMVIKVPQAQGGKVVNVQPAPEQGTKVANIKPSTVTDVKADLYRGKVDPVASRSKGMVWPVKGTVVNHFGNEGAGVSQSGINIKVPANSPVMAAESGVVVYADSGLKTYGNLVLLRHSNGMVTAYAHNNALLVTKGEKVKKGQTIALSGNTGSVKDPQLHFEVRKDARAVDPLSLLPR